MQLHNLTQGSPEWHAYRAQYFNASDAPAMMGCSPYKTRTQLLHEQHTGMTPEVDAAQQRRFDDGHRYEALARPLAEEFIGQDLYPVVGSEGRYSASSDGLTMDETIGFEHKTLNDDLRAVLVDGCTGADLPMHYRVQMEQQLMVFGSERILFMASKWAGEDLMEERHCWYESDPELRKAIFAGWEQFALDLEDYVPPTVEAKVIGRTPENLPALCIELTGGVKSSNLTEFKEHALTVFAGINRELSTDQEFADAEKAVKWCGDVEGRLEAAKANALSQTASIDLLFKTIDDITTEARRTRLELEKLVKARKDQLRLDAVMEGQKALAEHIAGLNNRLGKSYMPPVPADFGLAVKGKRTMDSTRGAVADELARAKIAASTIADKIQINLNTLRELAADHKALFPDAATIVLKANDDLTTLVNARIAEYKQREDEKEAAAAAKASAQQLQAPSPAPAPEPTPAPAESTAPFAQSARSVAPAATGDSEPSEATINLGGIAERLGFALPADFLSTLGFTPVATVKASKLYRASDFPKICAALIHHINQVCELQPA
jgi:putative phage-type endonuclease